MTNDRPPGLVRLARRLKREGALPFLAYCRRWLLYKAHYYASDRRYEKLEAVATARFIAAEDLDVSDERKAHVTSYLATPRLLIHTAIRAVAEPLDRFTFVDIGSGLGRALLVAGEYPFRRVVGYEISPGLHAAARRNIESFNAAGRLATATTSINEDAIAADWPAAPCVFYMFNSFDHALTERLIAKFAARARRGLADYAIFTNMKHPDLVSPRFMARVHPGPAGRGFLKLASPYPVDIYRLTKPAPIAMTAAA